MSIRQRHFRNCRGIALIVAMIFVAIFAALSVGFLSLSSANTQISSNHKQGNGALNAALSGLEVVRYWCSKSAPINGQTYQDKEQLFAPFFAAFQDTLPSTATAKLVPVYDPDTAVLKGFNIGSADNPISIRTNSVAGDSFYARFDKYDPKDPNAPCVYVTIYGQSGQLTRKISYRFTYGEHPLSYSVFDFGVATKGPLTLRGGTLTSSDAKITSYADVYIESLDDPLALGLLLNKSEIAGVAKIVNPNATVTAADIKGKVGGLSGQAAIDNTINVGVAPTPFPYPDALHFKQYATGGNYTSGATLTNKIIPAGAGTVKKPLKFTGNTTINGVLYIESPNVIDFGGNVTVHGMIVAAGDYENNLPTNKLSFTGSVDSADTMAPEKGTFLMAPGFSLAFTGSFGTVNGAIAGNGITFDGNAGGTVKGSVINYSTTKMEVNGSSNIVFNRSNKENTPSGFVTYKDWVVNADPASYEEEI